MTPTGIADYEFHEPTAKFVFTASSSLYQCVDDVAVTVSLTKYLSLESSRFTIRNPTYSASGIPTFTDGNKNARDNRSPYECHYLSRQFKSNCIC